MTRLSPAGIKPDNARGYWVCDGFSWEKRTGAGTKGDKQGTKWKSLETLDFTGENRCERVKISSFCPLVPWQSLYILYTFFYSRYKRIGSRGQGQKRAKKRRNGSTTGFIGVSFCPLTPEHLFFFGDKIFLWKSRKPSNHKGLKAFFGKKFCPRPKQTFDEISSNICLFNIRLSLDFTGFLVGDKMKIRGRFWKVWQIYGTVI